MRSKAAIAGRRFSALKLCKCGWGPNLTVILLVGSSRFKADSVSEDDAIADVCKKTKVFSLVNCKLRKKINIYIMIN